ncbi:Cerato-platanin-domain-containing protein [Fusarium venenatum]|uniref:Cerato-platanin-domain-containing protein n=1 Tax=Fusarium venenatum TaxID=56646 RepID=UPI001DCF1827|nr:Cerato-platanin-domain-containing protein [Fusarium venenatum]
MNHLSILLSVATLFSSTSAVLVTYNRTYDRGSTPISQLACYKDGIGMVPHYTNPEGKTISSFAPRIIGTKDVAGPDSSLCGSCMMLDYGEKARPFLVVTGAESGIQLSLEGMNALTGGRAEALGHIEVSTRRVALLNCGLVKSPGHLDDL